MRLISCLAILCPILCSIIIASCHQAASKPSNVELVPAYPALTFNAPIFLTAVPGTQQLAVMEQEGRVKVFDDKPDTHAARTVLDVTDRVLSGGEQGLLGLAFDPAFSSNRYVYLNYSKDQPRRNVITRLEWPANSEQIDPNTEVLLFEYNQPYSNHNGGSIEFGPDGYLYIGVGDGGAGGDPHGHGQDLTTLLGNILRIDVHPADGARYGIPESNPFAASDCCRPEIYSFGWRNPYRISFDRKTGELWAADVGQNRREEINIVRAGGNYGWNGYEASLIFDAAQANKAGNVIAPVFEYDHDQGSSITGGYVYRGEQHPDLIGHYIYADYVSGNVWALNAPTTGDTTNQQLGNISRPASFGETANGELLIVSRSGSLYQIK